MNAPCLLGYVRPTSYTRCRPTHPIPDQCWASVAAHCWFNTSQSFTTLAQRYSNTGPARHTSTPASTTTTGRLTNVALMVIQRVFRWPNNTPIHSVYIYFAVQHCAIAMRVTLSPPVFRKTTTQITRYISLIVKSCWATVCDTGPTLI